MDLCSSTNYIKALLLGQFKVGESVQSVLFCTVHTAERIAINLIKTLNFVSREFLVTANHYKIVMYNVVPR